MNYYVYILCLRFYLFTANNGIQNRSNDTKQQDAPKGIFAECLMWPHLFPLHALQIFETILANRIV